MDALFLMQCPSPDRNPTLNALSAMGLDFEVIYRKVGGSQQGWGQLPIRHPHRVARSDAEAARWTAAVLLNQPVGVLASFGYRHNPYVTGISLARLKRIPVIVRSDSNIDAAAADPPATRQTRRALLHAIIPRSAVAWTIGTKNAEWWAREAGILRQVLIPYEVPELPGGAPPRDRARNLNDPLRILYVGRLAKVKRVGDLIAAVKRIDREIRWQLTIVGQGPELRFLEASVDEGEPISFAGPVPFAELGPYYMNADVFVLPSSYEPWGLVVNEALGFGLRTIVTDAVGAAVDLIDGRNGAIVRVGDIPALTRELERCAQVTFQVGRTPETDTARLMYKSIRDVSILGGKGS